MGNARVQGHSGDISVFAKKFRDVWNFFQIFFHSTHNELPDVISSYCRTCRKSRGSTGPSVHDVYVQHGTFFCTNETRWPPQQLTRVHGYYVLCTIVDRRDVANMVINKPLVTQKSIFPPLFQSFVFRNRVFAFRLYFNIMIVILSSVYNIIFFCTI